MTNFTQTKSMFHLPEGIIYLDGNSLGPMPKAAQAKMNATLVDEWGGMLIKAWNDADWMQKPASTGTRIGNLIGAEANTITLGDTLSIKIYQALSSALDIAQDRDSARKTVLSDTGNFPTDLYMAQGLLRTRKGGYQLKLAQPEDIENTLDDSIAVLMLTHVDYRTGRMHDMARITKKARDLGIVTIWDLAHSAGAVEVDLAGVKADFAAGCTYKYLNSGPGGPAFIYVAPSLIDTLDPALSGWLGHDAPFAFDLDYRPGPSIERMRVGTPPILQFAPLEAALDIWDKVAMKDVRAKSIELAQLFITLIEQDCPALKLASPRDPAKRGSQVSYNFTNGHAAIKACIARGVIGDFRAPDIMRFGFTPLYIDENDIQRAAKIICNVVNSGEWQRDEFQQKSLVT